MATQTWTLDTAGLTYIDIDGIIHALKDAAQTIAFTFTDGGHGGYFVGVEDGARLAFLDGGSVDLECDPAFTSMYLYSDGADLGNGCNGVGEITFVEKNNTRHRYKVSSITATDADSTGANNITTITLESKARPNQKMIWTNINTA